MTAPVIPRDLVAGDILVLKDGERAEVGTCCFGTEAYLSLGPRDTRRGRIVAYLRNKLMHYWCDTGLEGYGESAPVVRVIRKKSKPAKQRMDNAALAAAKK